MPANQYPKYIEAYPYNLLTDLHGGIPTESPLTEDQLNGLEYALNQLPERHKKALLSWYKDGRAPDLISEEFGITPPSVQATRIKALAELRTPALYRGILYGLEVARKENGIYSKQLELERRLQELLRQEEQLEKEENHFRALAEKFGAEKEFFIESYKDKMFKTRSMELYTRISIDELRLTKRVHDILVEEGIQFIDQLIGKSDDDLMYLEKLGRKGADEIVERVFEFTGYDIRNNGKRSDVFWASPCSTCKYRNK